MKRIKRLFRAAALVALINFLGNTVASGQTVDVYGALKTPQEIQVDVMSGALWPLIVQKQPALSDCEPSRAITFGRKTLNSAKVRYDAALRFQECVAQVRNATIAASGANASAAALGFQTLDQLVDNKVEESAAEAQFMGMSFGVGVGVSYSEDERVSEAELAADNTIRATKTETQEPRVILESHYYGWCSIARCNEGSFGIGPFFGIVAKDDKLISAFALGAMVGWKDTKRTDSDGFSIGLGVLLDSDVSSLADGFEEGQPLPPGETEPQFEEKSRWGVLLFFTRTF